jgi:hypothetical protein
MLWALSPILGPILGLLGGITRQAATDGFSVASGAGSEGVFVSQGNLYPSRLKPSLTDNF